jgi:hypothetical protein
MLVKSRLVITLIVLLITLIAATAKAQTDQNAQIILNLLNGQQYFGVPHVYMGYYDNNVTTQWPAYYSPSNASQYWSLAGISSDQPVLELLGPALESSGAMYWPTHYEGGNITMSFITVYTAVNSTIVNSTYAYLYISPISVYLFIKPLGWDISSRYNFSIPCAHPLGFVHINSTYGFLPVVPMIPEGTANYLIVTWFPANQNPWLPENQNPWTIEVVNTTSTHPLTLTYLGGNGIVKPKPGDLLNVTIMYNPNTNTIYGMIRDINTSETSTFTASLNGNFTPPSSGYYVFGIGTASEWEIRCGPRPFSCTGLIPFQANWALLYAAVSQQPITPSPTYSVIFREVGLPLGTAWNVTLNGVTETSSSSSIVFTVPSGEYSYSVASPILVNGVEYVATEPTGTVAVNNANVTVTVQYVPATPPPPSRSSLAVQVFNVNNSPATSVPGVVYGVLYNSSGFKALAYLNSSGYLNFNNITPGTYTLEVYHYPNTGLNFTEYWGSETINVQLGYNGYVFTRHEPWIYDLQPMAGSGQIAVNVTVDNPLGNAVQGEVELWVTSNPSTASPYAPSAVRYVTLNPGLNTFTISSPVSQAGTYYVYAAVSAMISQYLPTDQWNWTLMISQYTTSIVANTATTIATTTATQTTVQPSTQTATAATSTSAQQSTVNANGQAQQIGVLQIATWALVGIVAFLLAYLLSGQRTR